MRECYIEIILTTGYNRTLPMPEEHAIELEQQYREDWRLDPAGNANVVAMRRRYDEPSVRENA